MNFDWDSGMQEILDILMLVAPNIVRCDLTLFPKCFLGSIFPMWQPMTFSQTPRSVHLPKLQSFSMRTADNGIDPTAFLSRLHMPVINKLSLNLDAVSIEDGQGSLHDEIMFIASSTNHLHRLNLGWTREGTDETAAESEIIEIIRASPQLRKLTLSAEYVFGNATVLGNLAELDMDGTPLFAPDVQILSFYLHDVNDLSPFVEAMELRCSAGSQCQLRIIKLKRIEGLRLKLSDKLAAKKRLCNVGVDLHFLGEWIDEYYR